MKAVPAPRLETRRKEQFAAELRDRARAWIPTWALDDAERDFAAALLDVAARFSSEVAERLDGAGEKMRLGFLEWLAVRPEAARPARVPVVLKMADNATAPVPAPAPLRLQADAGGVPVVFETEADLLVAAGSLDQVVAVDTADDAFYLPPPGLSSLEPLELVPTEWMAKTFAAAGAKKIQLDPDEGLVPGMEVETGGGHYRVQAVDKDIVTIAPPLAADLGPGVTVRKVTTFAPFDPGAINHQEHALYLGHTELFDIEAAATIDVVGAQILDATVAWEYWGKVKDQPGANVEADWRPLERDTNQPGDAVRLRKPAGAVEARDLSDINSRWIRAYKKALPLVTDPLLGVDRLEVRVNSTTCGADQPPCPDDPGPWAEAEAMANTTPLVLDSVFFPFGKEPRSFDAFYLGSKEAFSKKGASVQLCFEMADPTFNALSAVRAGPFAGNALAGVGKDRALHLFYFDFAGRMARLYGRDPLYPPAPGYQGQATAATQMLLDAQPPWRLPVWSDGDTPSTSTLSPGFRVAVSARDDIWVWYEDAADGTRSGWKPFGSLPAAVPPATHPVDGLVYLADASAPTLFALREGVLFDRNWYGGAQWDMVATIPAGLALESLEPVLVETNGLTTSLAEGMVGVSAGKLYTVAAGGAVQDTGVAGVDRAVRPVAVRRSDGTLVIACALAATATDPVKLASVREAPAGTFTTSSVPLGDGERVLGFDALVSNADLHFAASVERGSGAYLASWTPQTDVDPDIHVFRASVPSDIGQAGGMPTLNAPYVVLPGTRGDALVARFNVTERLSLTAGEMGDGVRAPELTSPFQVDDVVAVGGGAALLQRKLTSTGAVKTGEVFYTADSVFPPGTTGVVYGFHAAGTALVGDVVVASATLELDPTDTVTARGALVLVDTTVHRVTDFDPMTRLAKLAPPPATGGNNLDYWIGERIVGGRLAPFIKLDAANNNWDAALLERATLLFPGAAPADQAQTGKAFTLAGNHPVIVALGIDWTTSPVPTAPAPFVLDAAVGVWSRQLGDRSTNPELSWEYWNGRGWWTLDVILDQTLNLKTSGAIRFAVPSDIAATDWSGKANHWIRARLIGGDYGHETVTVTTTPTGNPGETKQTVERSAEGIHAPAVVRLRVSYRVCDAVRPTAVLAQDSGSMRDQSDANKTAGAIVEAFVPLAVTLARLSGAAAQSPESRESRECPPQCACEGAGAVTAAAGAPPADPAAADAVPARALFLGLTAPPVGGPVRVLAVVDEERQLDAFAPLAIHALVSDRFRPIVATDGTRGGGETGLLTLDFPLPPTERSLFGFSRGWLRLTPASPSADWRPSLRGVYLNAVWASAAETLTRELLGSSEGAPRLMVRLARPPVLRDSLELRVKEPLGDEERETLRATDATSVLTNLDDLPGDWVLWRRVVDPADADATERVYALDEASGVIVFGDGQHGMIPPIGRDSIVAFAYRRTEPAPAGSEAVPGNTIAARTTLNLVSPVESVEAVFAADQAAGGAPTETPERVLRFGTARVRHRGRALTAEDLEDLALQSAPDIVQARCVPRRRDVRVVIVMRGGDPGPDAAQIRELRRTLLAAAPPALSAPRALRIVGPDVRRLRVHLLLRVATLDDAGSVGSAAKARIRAFFDTATGGPRKGGWLLGDSPSEADVASALLDTPRLEGIAGISLREVGPPGVDRGWPIALEPTELAVLAADGVRVAFEPVEAVA